MTSTKKDPVLVVLQLSGGNDGMNTIIPYGDPLYVDNRPNVRINEDQVLPINDYIGFNSNMAPVKRLYDEGKVAVIQGIGYPHPSRSHFRSMDIWHTCEPDKIGNEGWMGRAIRDLDPNKDNVLTGVNFGRGLPRALAVPGVPVASVGNLETYGVLTGIEAEDQRAKALDVFSRVYSPMIGKGPVLDYFANTGLDALKGADILSSATEKYSSTVEYGGDEVAQYMRNIAMTHLAELGTRACAWCAGGLGGQPGDLRCADRHRGRGPAGEGPGCVLQSLLSHDRERASAGLFCQHGLGCLERG